MEVKTLKSKCESPVNMNQPIIIKTIIYKKIISLEFSFRYLHG